MVTAETAVVLPVLLLVLAGAVAAMIAVGAQLRCVDAAREGARSAARGDPASAVTALAAHVAPAGAAVEIRGGTDQVEVTVSADVAPLGPLPISVRVSASAAARREPAAADLPSVADLPAGTGRAVASTDAGG
jgi:Flp pilus assembly protein TadG